MPLIYSKTAKGVAEIATRMHKLAPRLRHALILVDGKRTDQALRALIQQQPVETVAWLLEHNFIDVLTSDTVPAALGALMPSPAGGLGLVLEARRREALHQVTEQLGPAGQAVALRIEKALTVEDLRGALSSGAQALNTYRGRDAAVAFIARFSDL
jgi:hypothetical protein